MRLIGTAGHIDHGKSALVEALTGTHPAHLPEEEARGMTIDLGFAHLEHPGGFRLGIVDVPGHENLVKNMVAGATGFELALWVVDAREGVMPQSTEHLHVLDLLGVRVVLPVVTKADLATEEQIADARLEIEILLKDSRVAAQPMRVVDSISGRGIAELKDAIFACCRVEAGEEGGAPFLPIDRVFTLQGVGTVVTGTLVRGRLAEGDAVAVSSQPDTCRVRSLTNHHDRVEKIGAGHRVGINLAGVEAHAVQRGDVLTVPEHPYVSRFLNVRLRLLDGVPFAYKHGLRLLFHAGAAETECRLWGLDAGDAAWWAQIELPEPMPFYPGQRFVLRNTNPVQVIGGGAVVDLSPDRPRRITAAEQVAYEKRLRDAPFLAAYVERADAPVLDLAALATRWMLPEDTLRAQAAAAAALRTSTDGLVWHTALDGRALGWLHDFAQDQPENEQLVPHDRLAKELDIAPEHLPPFLESLLTLGRSDAAFLRKHTRLDRAGWTLYPGRVTFTADEEALAETLLARLKSDGLEPPRLSDLRDEYADQIVLLDAVLQKLRAAGRVVPVENEFALHPEAEETLRHAVAEAAFEGASVADVGAALGLSRKYTIPYLDYLNRAGLMRREGNRHFTVKDR